MTLIQASRTRVIFDQCVSLILASAFPVLYLFSIQPDPNLPTFLKVIVGIISLFCAGYMAFLLRKIWRLFWATGKWRAVIDNDTLHWSAGLPHKDFPIEVNLADIVKTVKLVTLSKSTDNDTHEMHEFELHFRNSKVLSISHDDSGLNPDRVFIALQDHGIPYFRYKLDTTKDQEMPPANLK